MNRRSRETAARRARRAILGAAADDAYNRRVESHPGNQKLEAMCGACGIGLSWDERCRCPNCLERGVWYCMFGECHPDFG